MLYIIQWSSTDENESSFLIPPRMVQEFSTIQAGMTFCKMIISQHMEVVGDDMLGSLEAQLLPVTAYGPVVAKITEQDQNVYTH